MTTLQPGDAAPSFSLTDQHGNTVDLKDYRGRKLLVYFYPEADTPGCTTQSCDLRDHRQELPGMGRRARRLAETRFSRERMGEMFVKTLEEARAAF